MYGWSVEAITSGRIGARTFALVGIERVGGVMVYDVTEPSWARFEAYVNTPADLASDLGHETHTAGRFFCKDTPPLT